MSTISATRLRPTPALRSRRQPSLPGALGALVVALVTVLGRKQLRLENGANGERKTRQERRRERFLLTINAEKFVALTASPIDLDCLPFRVNKPTLGDAEARIGFQFRAAIDGSGTRREDFNDHVRSATDPVLEDRPMLVQNEQQIGFQHVK